MKAPTAPSRELVLRRKFASPREEVFEAWTDPDALVLWWGGVIAKTLSAAVDLRVGGSYRLTMQSGDQVFAVQGTYREVEAPELLVYTWRWDGLEIDSGRESQVSVEFHDHGGETEVVVTHEGIETEESFAFHEAGWSSSVDRLGQLLQAGEGKRNEAREEGDEEGNHGDCRGDRGLLATECRLRARKRQHV